MIIFTLQKMFKKAKEISDDKVQIAIQTYELVDKHIRKLDSDLAKFESEMKVPVILIIFFISSKSFFSITVPGISCDILQYWFHSLHF